MTAREAALKVLLAVEQGEKSHLALEQVVSESSLPDERDRRFARHLVKGTLERQLVLDHRINQKSRTPVKKMKPKIRALMRMSAYQICFMDKTPDSAVINEAVNLVKKSNMQGLSGFVNAVLRAVSREKEWGEESPELQTGIPAWILEKWKKERGESALASMIAGLEREEPVTFCRHDGMVSEKELMDSLAKDGASARPAPFPEGGYELMLNGSLTRLRAFRRGWIQIQDISSMLASSLAVSDFRECAHPTQRTSTEGRIRILDVCAAPGGKSIWMAEALGDAAEILSCDLTEEKTARIRENASRCGLKNLDVRVQDAGIFVPEWESAMDVVLADLPCSGLGVIGRKPEIRFLVTPDQIRELQKLQRKILRNVCRYVKPGGVLMYSTCTVTREENEENQRWICRELGLTPVDLRESLPPVLAQEKTAAEGYIQLLPGVHPCDGFFAAKFRRLAENSEPRE